MDVYRVFSIWSTAAVGNRKGYLVRVSYRRPIVVAKLKVCVLTNWAKVGLALRCERYPLSGLRESFPIVLKSVALNPHLVYVFCFYDVYNNELMAYGRDGIITQAPVKRGAGLVPSQRFE